MNSCKNALKEGRHVRQVAVERDTNQVEEDAGTVQEENHLFKRLTSRNSNKTKPKIPANKNHAIATVFLGWQAHQTPQHRHRPLDLGQQPPLLRYELLF